MYAHVHVCMYVCMYVCMHVCTYMSTGILPVYNTSSNDIQCSQCVDKAVEGGTGTDNATAVAAGK